MIRLSTPLSKAISTTKAYIEALADLNIKTVEDLLNYVPRTYEVHNDSNSISDLRVDQINTIEAKIISFQAVYSQRTRKSIYKAILEDDKGFEFEAVWFAKPFQLAAIKEGDRRVFVGKVKYDWGKFTFQSPKIERLADKMQARELFPVYAQSGDKLTTAWFAQKIKELLYLTKDFPENLAESVIKLESLMKKKDAMKQIHFPDSQELLEKARERLAFEELFRIQIDALQRKKDFQTVADKHDISIKMDVDLIKQFFATLPFTPTNAQKIAIFEILKDMEKEIPMSRLLEGDVGSGKTLVAAAVSLAAIKSGYQVAIMAPTEVLARQHFQNFQKMFEVYLDIKIGLLLGSQKKAEKQENLLACVTGEANIVIGTHALIQESVDFVNLGLAIIDEQHRFGVEQRKKLSSHGHPHTLNMTATPIPRTLALIAYGDQDLSVLNEMPPGRREIITKVVVPSGRREISLFIDSEIEKGQQAYVVCPLIEESKADSMSDVKSVTEEHKRLEELFPHRRIALLHGKMKSDEKNQIMADFKARKSDILVSTSVIEVGVDVPNSTIMIIEGAERFGLSQLHQFRGRVGRGDHQSYCFLFSSKLGGQDNERLQAMEKYADGFRLAEIDMRLRGAGEVYGLRQSGIPDLKMAKLTDQEFVFRVRKAAELEFERAP